MFTMRLKMWIQMIKKSTTPHDKTYFFPISSVDFVFCFVVFDWIALFCFLSFSENEMWFTSFSEVFFFCKIIITNALYKQHNRRMTIAFPSVFFILLFTCNHHPMTHSYLNTKRNLIECGNSMSRNVNFFLTKRFVFFAMEMHRFLINLNWKLWNSFVLNVIGSMCFPEISFRWWHEEFGIFRLSEMIWNEKIFKWNFFF